MHVINAHGGADVQRHSLFTLGLDVSGQPQALATLPPW